MLPAGVPLIKVAAAGSERTMTRRRVQATGPWRSPYVLALLEKGNVEAVPCIRLRGVQDWFQDVGTPCERRPVPRASRIASVRCQSATKLSAAPVPPQLRQRSCIPLCLVDGLWQRVSVPKSFHPRFSAAARVLGCTEHLKTFGSTYTSIPLRTFVKHPVCRLLIQRRHSYLENPQQMLPRPRMTSRFAYLSYISLCTYLQELLRFTQWSGDVKDLLDTS